MIFRRLAREPLVHFLVLGALLFALYGWVNRHGFGTRDEILVSRARIEGLETQFERVWQRPPDDRELQTLIDAWVRDEIYYREAIAMGLDQDDPVVRRRLSQKIQFIIDSGTPAAPTEAELQGWLDAHARDYRVAATYALRQVYFDPARHGGKLEPLLASTRRSLDAGRSVAGDSTMLPPDFEGSASDVTRAFGEEFEVALRALPTGSWQGPVQSGFGLHFVELTAREAERPARLDEARAAVERDLLQSRAEAATEAFYDRLRRKYAVTIEDGGGAPQPAG